MMEVITYIQKFDVIKNYANKFMLWIKFDKSADDLMYLLEEKKHLNFATYSLFARSMYLFNKSNLNFYRSRSLH